ncbi:gamma-glutamylcyclotransferase [Tropicibacter naphthalenivorans]|uniref:gamma-glutamylcyclotransferase n=1 Tax=Tropicibacter naphthalenivorans TaxID=441103 RepID=UPI00245575DE|nr:gamma-glutamylcyclotransferase [Tropicibacter naphthalenivorans]
MFFYGTLRHLPLLECVLGRVPDNAPAVLADHAVYWAQDEAFPVIAPQPGAQAKGLLVRGLTSADLEALDFYEGGFGYDARPVTVTVDGQGAQALVYFPPEGKFTAGAPWSLDAWRQDWEEITMRAAAEVMARRTTHSAAEIRGMLPFFRSRAWAQQIARTPAPQTVRNPMTMDQVEITGKRPGFHGFFTMNAFKLRYRRFDGDWSPELPRECFMSFDVALVLPYDPVLDKVLLVEQLRFGPVQRGDPAPWVLEPIAGLVDARETPEAAARREAVEEAHLTLTDLRPMVRGYASPGYSTEFYHSFLGLCDLSGRGQSQGGLEAENEDIRNHVIAFTDAMDLLDTGEINAAPLAMMLLWLATKREALRAAA